MATFLVDAFNGDDGDLNTHTANTGGQWARVSWSSNGITCGSAGYAYGIAAATSFYTNPAAPANANYEVEAILTGHSDNSSTAGVIARYIDAGGSDVQMYHVRHTFGTGWVLAVSSTSGTSTLGTYAGSFTNNQQYTVKLVCNGNQISVYIDGTLRIGPITNSVASGPGRAGISALNTGSRVYNITATDVAPAAVAKFSIPTTAPDGTSRKLWVYSDTTLATAIVSNQTVVAAGGFFKYTHGSAALGTYYPAVLAGFGASQSVAGFGGVAWAVGILE